MNAFLKITVSYWKQILAITLLTLLAAVAFRASAGNEQFTGTTFLTIGVEETDANTATTSSIYENVQAADHFSESVQGWFKNPSLLKTIEEKTGKRIEINAKKQEKQNVVITYSDTKKESLEKADKIIKEQLQKSIEEYNSATGTRFHLALYNTVIEESTKSYVLYVTLGLIVGLFLGFSLTAVYQKIQQELKHLAK
jgi:capsular polysaccharide biosynthesis protein